MSVCFIVCTLFPEAHLSVIKSSERLSKDNGSIKKTLYVDHRLLLRKSIYFLVLHSWSDHCKKGQV